MSRRCGEVRLTFDVLTAYGVIVLCIYSKKWPIFCRLLPPEPPLESDAVAELEVEEEAETREVSKKDMDAVVKVEEEIETRSVLPRFTEEVKNTASNDRLSCSSATSSSSSAGSWRDRAGHQYQRALGDLFIRYVDDQDGVRQTLRGKDADSTLYEAAMRLDHYDSCDEEDLVGMSKEQQMRRKYSTMSCGYAPDGSTRRLPKKQLRYSRESLIATLNTMIRPHTNALLPYSEGPGSTTYATHS